MYSMHDLVETQSGRLAAFLSELSDGWLQHIVRCELCRGKGSICEVCNSERPIYPFQVHHPECTHQALVNPDSRDLIGDPALCTARACVVTADAHDDQVRSVPCAVPPGVL
jgi:hypothetical protein